MPVKCGERAGTAKSDNSSSLDAVFEPHVGNEATTHVGADIASAGANGEEINLFNRSALNSRNPQSLDTLYEQHRAGSAD